MALRHQAMTSEVTAAVTNAHLFCICCRMRQFPPRRIVCLTEETVETLYLLGEQDRIVGVSGYAVRPPQVRREKPRVSAFISADIPKILALEPDLVLAVRKLRLRSNPRVNVVDHGDWVAVGERIPANVPVVGITRGHERSFVGHSPASPSPLF